MTPDAPFPPDLDDRSVGGFDRPSPRVVRLAAAIVDFTIVAVLVLPVQLLWTAYGTGADSSRQVPTTGSNWVALAIIVGYPVVNIARSGQTVGKRLFSLKVLRLDGGRVGWVRSIVRFAVSYAPLLAGPLLGAVDPGGLRTFLEYAQVALMLLIYLPILLDESRRGLHDRVAGTQVRCKVPPLLRAAESLQQAPASDPQS